MHPSYRSGLPQRSPPACSEMSVKNDLHSDLAPTYFDSLSDNPVTTLRMLHYWPLTCKDFEKKISAGAHTDYGCCTILLQDRTGGLQVLNSRRKEWVHVPPMEGALVVNLGDMLARWTNHRYSSTIHRVINTSDQERFSLPFFFNPNLDARIECLPNCQSERRPLEPATCEDILTAFYQKAGLIK